MSRIDTLRTELGGAHPLAATKVKDYLEPYVRAFIEHSPFAVMASSNANGDCDASPKGGKPGFIKVIDEAYRTSTVPGRFSSPTCGIPKRSKRTRNARSRI
jgi:uncharacterized protein